MQEESTTVLDPDQMKQGMENLHKIEQEKKAEDRTAVIIHTLAERADIWGRKRLAEVSRETSTEAGRLIHAQVKLLHEADVAHGRLVASAKAKVKKAMQQLQDQLCEELRKLSADKLAATDKIRNEFKPKLDEQEGKLEATNISVTDTVGKFIAYIQGMPLYDLEKVAEGKVVRILEERDGVEHTVAVVCPDVEGP